MFQSQQADKRYKYIRCPIHFQQGSDFRLGQMVKPKDTSRALTLFVDQYRDRMTKVIHPIH